MTTGRKVVLVSGGALIAAILLAIYVVFWLAYNPQTIVGTPAVSSSGQTQTNLTLATVGEIQYGTHPSWVSYLVRHDGKWVHSTVFQVPAHSLIHVTLDEYDTQTGLRNPFFSMIRGTTSGTETVNGKSVKYMNPNDVAHTFSIPEIGLNIPLYGVPNSSYPGTLTNPHQTHEVITFSFRTPGAQTLHWQCFVPCAAGFLYGQGGPMQTIGYMDGYLKIVNK